MKREGKKKGWTKRRKDLLVFVLINLFGERDSFSYGRHISYVDREGVEVVSCNTKLDKYLVTPIPMQFSVQRTDKNCKVLEANLKILPNRYWSTSIFFPSSHFRSLSQSLENFRNSFKTHIFFNTSKRNKNKQKTKQNKTTRKTTDIISGRKRTIRGFHGMHISVDLCSKTILLQI